MRVFLAIAPCAVLIAGAAPAQPVATPAQQAASDRANEIICRKETETGSLVRKKKVCYSRAQWLAHDDAHQKFGRQIVEDGTTRPSGE